MSSSTLKVFSNQMYNLCNTLHNRFPENKQISLSLTGIETLKNSNSKKLFEIFLKHGYKYRDKVMNKDEAFMLDTNLLEEEHKSTDNEDIMNTLKSQWKSLDSEEKEHIWKYLQVLMKLSDKYLSENLKSN